ncbi:MAG: acylphosphatase [Steroidobacteraceae bacterium]
MDPITRRFLVFGKVQGVFFRHSTRLEADRLGLRGIARNLPDGSVEVIAQGEPTAVGELRDWLHRGPAQARVDEVREAAPEAAQPLPKGFITA